MSNEPPPSYPMNRFLNRFADVEKERDDLAALLDAARIELAEQAREIERLRAGAAPSQWYVYDPEDGISRYNTADEAKARAEEIMDEEGDRAASDGWRDDIESLEWGAMACYGRACCIKNENAPEGSEFDEIQEWAVLSMPDAEEKAR